jgi:lysophospholipase L1-like esterase
MNSRRLCLGVIFWMLVLTAFGDARQAVGNKWEAEIKKFEDSDRQMPPPQGGIVFIGSSSIRLWQTLGADFPGTKVINRGFGGSEIADSTFYVDRIVVPYHPKMVVLYAGDNDLASGKAPEQVFAAYKKFVESVERELPTTKIAFISIKPSPARLALMPGMKDANGLIKAYIAADNRLIYIDVYEPMLGKDGVPRPELFGPDKLHMNIEGYKLWRLIIAPYLR